MSSIRLTAKEAHTLLDLRVRLEEHRVLVSEYLLLRASLSVDKTEKRAWYILAALLSYIERKHRFPRMKEQIEYIGIVLGTSMVPDLPPLTPIDLIVVSEVADQARSSLRTSKKSKSGDQDNES